MLIFIPYLVHLELVVLDFALLVVLVDGQILFVGSYSQIRFK